MQMRRIHDLEAQLAGANERAAQSARARNHMTIALEATRRQQASAAWPGSGVPATRHAGALAGPVPQRPPRLWSAPAARRPKWSPHAETLLHSGRGAPAAPWKVAASRPMVSEV